MKRWLGQPQAPGPVWMLSKNRKSLALARIQTPDRARTQ